MAKPVTRIAQFKRLLHAAASELGVRRSHDAAQRLATCRLQRIVIRETQQAALLSGKLSDPSRLLDCDEKLRLEEERLLAAAPRDNSAPYLIIQPVRLIERDTPAPAPPPVVALPVPLSDAAPVEVKPEASKPKPSNVVELKHLTASEIVDRAGCTKPTSRSR